MRNAQLPGTGCRDASRGVSVHGGGEGSGEGSGVSWAKASRHAEPPARPDARPPAGVGLRPVVLTFPTRKLGLGQPSCLQPAARGLPPRPRPRVPLPR